MAGNGSSVAGDVNVPALKKVPASASANPTKQRRRTLSVAMRPKSFDWADTMPRISRVDERYRRGYTRGRTLSALADAATQAALEFVRRPWMWESISSLIYLTNAEEPEGRTNALVAILELNGKSN